MEPIDRLTQEKGESNLVRIPGYFRDGRVGQGQGPLQKAERNRCRGGVSGMDAARDASGHGWPVAAYPGAMM